MASLLTKELDEPGSVAPETLAEAEHDLISAQLNLKRLERTDVLTQQKELIAAQVKIQQLQEQIEQSRIVAPFDGNVYFILPTEDMIRLPVAQNSRSSRNSKWVGRRRCSGTTIGVTR